MKTKHIPSLLLALVVVLSMGSANAMMLSIQPSTQNVEVSDIFTVDFMVSDFKPDTIAAFDLFLSYDSSILNAVSFDFGGSLGDPFFFETFQDADLGTPGLVNIAELSLLFDFELDSLQAGMFSLGTLTFAAIGEGISALNWELDPFGFIDIKDGFGDLLNVTANNGSVTVGDISIGLPEPGTFGLLLIGLMGTFCSKRRAV